MSEKIIGKVATILSRRTLAINRGEMHGVITGMKFAVITPVEIKDPVTKDVLGTVPYRKVTLEIISVHEKFSIAQPSMKYSTVAFPDITTRSGTFNVKKPELHFSSYINIGDTVIEL